MLTILTDVQLTRRKRVNLVLDEGGSFIMAAPTLEAALDYILERGEHSALLEVGEVHLYQLNLDQLADTHRRNPRKTAHPVI